MCIFPGLLANSVNEQPGYTQLLGVGRMFSWVICNYLRTVLEGHEVQKELQCVHM